MYDYTPNERIVDRAISIWIEMLRVPKYDNLGKDSPESAQSKIQNTMASLLAASIPKNNTEDVLAKFGQELKPFLMAPTEFTRTDRDGKQTTEKRMFNWLSVDYHPDEVLSVAAERAGLEMQFPWKTSMHIDETYVSVTNGYGADRVYHYPLTNDRWLVTTLTGSDIEKIIALVEANVLDPDLNPI